MKKIKIAAIALLGIFAVSCGSAQDPALKELEPTKAETDSVSYLLGINFGSMMKGNNLTGLNMSRIEDGINDFLGAEGDPSQYQDSTFLAQFEINPMEMNRIISAYIEKKAAYEAALNDKAQQDFLAEIEASGEYTKTPSGLFYMIVGEGDQSRKPASDSDVYATYKGMFKNGEVFDENENTKFNLSRVIAGWTEGLQLIGQGGEIDLVIPSALGYGERGDRWGKIKGNTPLHFTIKLDSVVVKAPVEVAE